MESSTVSTPDQRRAGLFRPIVLLVLGALLMLMAVGNYLVGQIASAARFYEQAIVERSWQATVVQFGDVFATLAQQDQAAARFAKADQRWIEQALAAPMRQTTGASQITIRPAIGHALPRQRTLLVNGQPVLALAAQLGKDPKAPMIEALVPFDGTMLNQFGRHHHLAELAARAGSIKTGDVFTIPLADAKGQSVAQLAWRPSDPVSDLRSRLPAILAFFGSLFGLAVFYVMRQSKTITSDLIASEARARHLAFHDTLTGMPNRAMMFDRLGQLLAMSRRYYGETALHCLDLDRFKEVNDLLGHPAGDELIRQVADRVTELCRDSDTVARMGGDEFVILQPETNAAGASHLAARVLKLFETPFELEAGTVEVGVSIGVTLITNPDLDPAEALRQADLALYGSKEGGRNRVTFFEPDMDAALRMRRGLEADLRKALANGGLEMVYQPQQDSRGHISTMEALVRWNHPERGAIGPTIFVPLCEESGLILDLGEYIFRRVFEETRDWINMRVAINVSALQLRSPMFMGNLTRLVAEFRVDPSRYEIEITETALLGDDSTTRDNIIMLKQEGFSIALDDFGTGMSSLNMLKRFAVDKIKIDRSFIHNLEGNAEAEGLVDAIVKLGRALKLDIVAEGVETEHQRNRLEACGCDNFQGYLVSKPVAASEMDGLFFG
jgi:diguanylate cyclase (GGDEF)-like protein